jgi:hypothetical protein
MTDEQPTFTRAHGIFRKLEPEHGGSLITEFWASYKDLVRVLGEPNSPGDEYKVSTEWVLETDEGIEFTIYDWKETSLYGGDGYPSVEDFRDMDGYSWHVGGPNEGWGSPTPRWAQRAISSIQAAIRQLKNTGES